MDDKTKKEMKIISIILIIFFLYIIILYSFFNTVNLPFLSNLFASIFVGFFGVLTYPGIVKTLNTKELLSAFLLSTLASFLLFSIINNVALKLFGLFIIVFIITPLIVSIIFDSMTERVKMWIIYIIVYLIAIFLFVAFILH